MTVSIADLVVTENYDTTSPLLLTEMNTAMTSIETHNNTKLARNLEQLAKDCWGNANYTFTDDGVASKTNTLFEKQVVTDSYNGGNISIGVAADVGWAAVDAVNASVTITPEVAGKYRAIFTFTHRATSTATTEFSIDTGFRLTDGTDASQIQNSGGYLPATAANSGVFIHVVHLECVFTWATTTAKTITLQKYNRTCTNVNANVVCAAAASGEISMSVEKL